MTICNSKERSTINNCEGVKKFFFIKVHEFLLSLVKIGHNYRHIIIVTYWYILAYIGTGIYTGIPYSGLFSRGVYFTNFEISAIPAINFRETN